MSLDPRVRKNLRDDLKMILGFTQVGPVRYQNVVLAQHRAREWQAVSAPSVAAGPVTICERCAHDREGAVCSWCGDTSPPIPLRTGSQSETAERVEDRRVARQALRDTDTLLHLVPAFEAELVLARYTGAPTRELAQVADRLAEIVSRCVQNVDHDKLIEGPVGCRSCARTNPKKGITGHFEPVSTRYATKGLCDQCGRYAGANKGRLPPVEYVDVLARQGKHAAGRWLARQQRKGAA